MTDRPTDTLLLFGRGLSAVLQGACALAGTVVVLLIPAVLLAGLGIFDPLGISDIRIVEMSLLSVAAILSMLAAIVAALYLFFGKMRALIASVGDGDPFIPENARRLGAMAWLLLGAQILGLLVGGLRLNLANRVSDTEDSLDFSIYDLDVILVVIVLFILARIFRVGAAMRDDLEGTV